MGLCFLGLGLVVSLAGQGTEGAAWERVELPPCALTRALAGIEPAAPLAPKDPWPAWEDRSPSGWAGEGPWRRWIELLRAEAAESDPARRADLVVLARSQGRDADAWVHLRACLDQPGRVAALLPLFSPGVPLEALGSPGPLPDGVVLRPALPPSDDPRGSLRFLAGSQITHQGFAVGSATCSLSVAVDRDGLEVSLRHLGGGRARIGVLAPLPRGVERGLLFADWEKRPGHVGPIEFVLDAEQPEHSLWLTFHAPDERWPNPPLGTLAGLVPGRALVLTSPRGDEPHLARFAEALGELLGAPASLRAAEAPVPDGLEPLVLRFDASRSSERKLVELLGLAEAFALRGPVR